MKKIVLLLLIILTVSCSNSNVNGSLTKRYSQLEERFQSLLEYPINRRELNRLEKDFEDYCNKLKKIKPQNKEIKNLTNKCEKKLMYLKDLQD